MEIIHGIGLSRKTRNVCPLSIPLERAKHTLIRFGRDVCGFARPNAETCESRTSALL